MIRIFSLILFLTSSFSVLAQNIDQTELLASNEIIRVNTSRFVYDYDSKEYFRDDYGRFDSINVNGNTFYTYRDKEPVSILITKHRYDFNGNKAESTVTNVMTKEMLVKNIYEYNQNNQLIIDEYFNSDKDFDKLTSYEYDDKGRTKLKTIYQISADRTTDYKYKYKKDLLKNVKCKQDNKFVFDTKYVYNINNKLSKIFRKRDEKTWSFISYEYNDALQLRSKRYSQIAHIIDAKNFVFLTIADIRVRKDILDYEYTYDQKTGLVSKMTEYKNEKPIAYFQYEYVSDK